MIEIRLNSKIIERAKKLYDFGELNGSITKGKSNIYGAIGEIVVFDYFREKGLDVEFESTYDYDMVIQDYKIDVKTKKTTVSPKDYYLCSVSAFNTTQKCDFYFFVRVDQNLEVCYLLGYKRKDRFLKEASFKRKGDLDINGWKFKDDCYNIEISKLEKFKEW